MIRQWCTVTATVVRVLAHNEMNFLLVRLNVVLDVLVLQTRSSTKGDAFWKISVLQVCLCLVIKSKLQTTF